jgi:hypothetical protein
MRTGLPPKAQKQLEDLRPQLSAARRQVLDLLLEDLRALETARDDLARQGGEDPETQLWWRYCEKKNRALELKTTIKHLLNVWAPERYE